MKVMSSTNSDPYNAGTEGSDTSSRRIVKNPALYHNRSATCTYRIPHIDGTISILPVMTKYRPGRAPPSRLT